VEDNAVEPQQRNQRILTMKSMQRYVVMSAFAAIAASVLGLVTPGKAANKVAAAQVADHYVGRVLVAADFSSGQVIGYYTFLEGITGPFFSGTPGEATAFFTLRSDVFSLQTIGNGPVAATLADAGDFTIYLNPTPAGNWSDPNSFSSGQPVATFKRSVAMLTNAGPTTSVMFSAVLVSSVDFTFNGKTYNFKRLVPDGVTHIFTGSNVVLTGPAKFPVAFAFAGSDLGIGNNKSAEER
jgi:hypothetical protein